MLVRFLDNIGSTPWAGHLFFIPKRRIRVNSKFSILQTYVNIFIRGYYNGFIKQNKYILFNLNSFPILNINPSTIITYFELSSLLKSLNIKISLLDIAREN